MPPDTVVNHVGLCVGDVERSRRFYVELLGFEPDGELEPPDDPSAQLLGLDPPVGVRAVYLRRGPFRLELLAYGSRAVRRPAQERTMDEVGLTHLSFGVDDIPATCALVIEHGGEVLADTELAGMAIMVKDPDGQLLELLPRPPAR